MRQNKKTRTAIVIGNNHDNTLNVIRALGVGGFSVELLIVTKSKKNYITKSKYVNSTVVFEDESELLQHLIKTERQDKLPVITTSDSLASFIDSNYDVLKSKYILPNCNDTAGALITEMDKERMGNIANECGFIVPKTVSFKRDIDMADDIQNFAYPVIVKPEQSILGSKDDFRICKSFDDLMYVINIELTHINDFIIQEFIPNDEVLLIAGVRTLDGQIYQKGFVNKSKHGKQLSNLGMNSLGIYTSQDLFKEECKKYLTTINYYGPYSFEFVRHNGKTFFIEINLRTDGLYFFFTHAGINIPTIWATNGDNTNACAMENIKERVIGMCEFQYIKNYFSPSHIISAIRDIVKTDVFSIASSKDIKPFIYKFLYHHYEA